MKQYSTANFTVPGEVNASLRNYCERKNISQQQGMRMLVANYYRLKDRYDLIEIDPSKCHDIIPYYQNFNDSDFKVIESNRANLSDKGLWSSTMRSILTMQLMREGYRINLNDIIKKEKDEIVKVDNEVKADDVENDNEVKEEENVTPPVTETSSKHHIVIKGIDEYLANEDKIKERDGDFVFDKRTSDTTKLITFWNIYKRIMEENKTATALYNENRELKRKIQELNKDITEKDKLIEMFTDKQRDYLDVSIDDLNANIRKSIELNLSKVNITMNSDSVADSIMKKMNDGIYEMLSKFKEEFDKINNSGSNFDKDFDVSKLTLEQAIKVYDYIDKLFKGRGK